MRPFYVPQTVETSSYQLLDLAINNSNNKKQDCKLNFNFRYFTDLLSLAVLPHDGIVVVVSDEFGSELSLVGYKEPSYIKGTESCVSVLYKVFSKSDHSKPSYHPVSLHEA